MVIFLLHLLDRIMLTMLSGIMIIYIDQNWSKYSWINNTFGTELCQYCIFFAFKCTSVFKVYINSIYSCCLICWIVVSYSNTVLYHSITCTARGVMMQYSDSLKACMCTCSCWCTRCIYSKLILDILTMFEPFLPVKKR